MTKLLYLENSYVRSFKANVMAIQGRAERLVLDSTHFYPRGGGQPADSGAIKYLDEEFRVRSVEKVNEDVVHELEGGSVPLGSEVTCEIDWDARYKFMRHHTALHILCGAVWQLFKSISTGSAIYEDRARIDFDIPSFSKQQVGEIESVCNEVVKQRRRVIYCFMRRSDIEGRQDLIRVREELLPTTPIVRTVIIEGFDEQLDGGTHVANTGEVGLLKITRVESKGRHNRRFEIRLSEPLINPSASSIVKRLD